MDLQTANNDMVDQFIAEGALWSPPLIAAFRATPRHWFVRRIFQYQHTSEQWQERVLRDPSPEEIDLLYTDRAWITHVKTDAAGGTIPVSSSSQPSLMAQMLEEMQLQPGLRVLEVGAGTGYNSALIAHVVGGGLVVAIDLDIDVVSEAWDHLRNVAVRGVAVHQGDGRFGFPDRAPYDRIVVTASSDDVEPAWIGQLSDGGALSVPLNIAPGLGYVLRAEVQSGVLRGRLTRPAYFLSLRDEADFVADESQSELPEAKHVVPAPWAKWMERRSSRLKWFPLAQSLAFWGWLHGFTIRQRTDPSGQTAFAVASPDSKSWCWMSTHQWQFNNKAGRRLADELWKSFLKHGGPWPTDFRLTVTPNRRLTQDLDVAFRKQGPRSAQLWELTPGRRRPAW